MLLKAIYSVSPSVFTSDSFVLCSLPSKPIFVSVDSQLEQWDKLFVIRFQHRSSLTQCYIPLPGRQLAVELHLWYTLKWWCNTFTLFILTTLESIRKTSIHSSTRYFMWKCTESSQTQKQTIISYRIKMVMNRHFTPWAQKSFLVKCSGFY